MNARHGRIAVTSLEDLTLAADMVSARCSDARLESRRIASARRLVERALQLEKALAMHARCVVANHHGLARAHNLPEVTNILFSALTAYSEAVRDCGATVRRDADRFDPLFGAAGGSWTHQPCR